VRIGEEQERLTGEVEPLHGFPVAQARCGLTVSGTSVGGSGCPVG
jgi:hypothetical protein